MPGVCGGWLFYNKHVCVRGMIWEGFIHSCLKSGCRLRERPGPGGVLLSIGPSWHMGHGWAPLPSPCALMAGARKKQGVDMPAKMCVRVILRPAFFGVAWSVVAGAFDVALSASSIGMFR